MSKKKSSEITFEEAMKELETLIESMESEEITLDALIDKYERGSELLKLCQKTLGDAELRIEKIKENNEDDLEITNFE